MPSTVKRHRFQLAQCIEFTGQGFGSGGLQRFWERLLLCLIVPRAAGSKRGLLWARDEPIRNGGSASGIT